MTSPWVDVPQVLPETPGITVLQAVSVPGPTALSSADLTRIIHILDTEHPWDVHSINSEHSEAITCLEWDQSGEGPPGLFLYGEGDMMLTFDPESQGSSAVFLVTSPESRAGT